MPGIDRRTLLRATGAAALAAATAGTAGCGGPLLNSASGGTPLRYWNLFGGGDGVLMNKLLDEFRAANRDIALESVTLAWGAPYYTKLAMAAAGGRAPDVAVLHLARLSGYAPGRLLDPFDLDELAAAGVREQDILPALWKAASSDGRLYAVPLDTHPFVLYYNTEVCKEAGLLGADGKLAPIKGPDALLAAIRKAKQVTGGVGLALDTQDVMPWRLFWALYRQADGQLGLPVGGRTQIDREKALTVLRFMRRLTSDGLAVPSIDYAGAVATFAGGKAGIMLNGDWEVTTLLTAKLPFSMALLPDVYGSRRTSGDSHSLVLPHQRSRDPEQTRAGYKLIGYLLQHSVEWAKAGHIPAYQPIVNSQEYLALQPQSEYRDAATSMELDPPAWFTGSASSMQTQAGSAFGAVLGGQLSPEAGLDQFVAAIDKLLNTPSPI